MLLVLVAVFAGHLLPLKTEISDGELEYRATISESTVHDLLVIKNSHILLISDFSRNR